MVGPPANSWQRYYICPLEWEQQNWPKEVPGVGLYGIYFNSLIYTFRNCTSADRPHPDVDLTLVAAANIDAGVHVVDFDLHFLAVTVFEVAAVRQNDRNVFVLKSRLQLETPINPQDEVAEGFVTPQALVTL